MAETGKTKRILVIDDSAVVLNWVRMNLTPLGFEVTTSNTPFEVQGLINQTQPDLILLDVRMDNLSGDLLCKMLKKDETHKNRVIVLYSSLPEDELAPLAKTCAADGFIHKTDDVEALVARINQFMALADEPETGDPKKRTITLAVVDDSPLALLWVQQSLNSRGFEVRTWNSPIGAQELIERSNPDAVLMDVKMPIQTGDKLCQMLKDNPPTADIPILLYSQLPEGELAELAKTSRADGYIVKRDDPDSLADEIRTSLEDTSGD